MAANSIPAITLWLKSEPFTIGALPTPPNPRLTISNIKRIIPYARTKSRSGFPNLGYSVWKHIASNKLLLPEDLTWTYFWTYDLLGDRTPEQRLEWQERFAKASSDPQSQETLKHQLTVPVLKFVLLLYIQHIHKISLRASLVSGSDEWPTRTRSPDLESRSASSSKALDENSHLTFILNNLNEILEILAESDQHGTSFNAKDLVLSMEAVEALDFLISGSVDVAKNIKPMHEIAMLHPSKSGFSKSTKSFSFRIFQTWLRSNLSRSPYGVATCIAQGRHLCWPLAGESKEKWAEKKKGRIATNTVFVPREHVKGNKLIVMSQVSWMTIARSSGTLEGATLKIHRCHDAFIYLLSPLRSVSIEKCQRTTVVLGAVEVALDMVQCEYMTVISVCQRFTANTCKSCTIHVMTPNPPLLFSGNESLIFGPYHTFYGKLEEHMALLGLAPRPNLWDKPLYIGADVQDESTVYEIQRPATFSTFSIPFELEGDTEAIPGGLPARYQKAVAQRRHQIDSWQSLVRDSHLSKDQKRAFHEVVQTRFQEWLQASGNGRQLEGLVVPNLTNKSG